MTDARTTQIAIEQWGNGNPAAQLTQVAIEQWASSNSGSVRAVLTQVALEQWAKQAPPPPLYGTYHPGIAERWDRGRWDSAHWDGQIGIEASPAAIVVTGNDVDLKLSHAYVMVADPATTIMVTGQSATLARDHICIPYNIKAKSFQITVDGKVAAMQRGDTMPPPGRLTFGIPRILRGGW